MVERRRTWHVLLLAGCCLWVCALAWRYYFATGEVKRHHLEIAFFALAASAFAAAYDGRGGIGSRAPMAKGAVASGGLRLWPLAAALVLASLALYGPALGLGLLSDDFVLLARAEQGRISSLARDAFFRPLPLALWAVVVHIPGNAEAALHALNVVLHGANACLTAWLARRLGLEERAAVLAGALFLTWPAAAEAVAWCSGIQDVLLVTLGLGFVLLASAPRRRLLAGTLALIALLLALASKETAVALPLLAIVVARLRGGNARAASLATPLLGAALAGAYVLFRVLVVGLPEGYPVAPSRYFVKELLVRPFAALGAPWSRELLERLPLAGFLSVSGVAVLVGLGALRARENPDARGRAIGLTLWVLLSVLPVYSLLFVSPDLAGSRYLYLGEAGFAILLADLLAGGRSPWRGARVARAAVAVAVLAASAGAATFHLAAWREAAALRDRVLAAAGAALGARPCARVSLGNPPDAIGGAYVFRNGFSEALTREGLAAADRDAGVLAGPCRLEWDGSAFRAAGDDDR